ncbi:mucin-17-like isoform X2 [Dermacentor albipictus]|uniref:mucin-17-like isoform X2 n=1 Tax=Dermacentor albipictus TaxID=60249 RepID=UPI0031FC4889
MSSEFSRRPMTTASDSSSQSSDGAEINANQTGVRGDDTDSSPKVLLTDVEHLPQPKVPPGSTAEKGTVSALKRGVTDAAKVKPGDAMAIVAPRTPSVGSATKRSLDYSTESINRAVRLAQQNLASVWQRPPDQRSGRRGGEKPGYDDEEGMVATPPGGGGRGATGRARPTKHPKAVASPAMRAPAPPAVVSPPAAQIGGVRPGAKEPVRPRLLSEKGLVRAVPAEHALKTGTAVEHPSAQPMASGAEVTAKQPPGSGMTDARRRYSVAASPESPEQRMQPSGWVAGAPMQQRRPSYFASREDLGQRRKSIVSDALAAGSGRRPLSVGFRRSLEDTWNRDSDEETSSSSPPLEDTATAPVLPLMRRPPADLKPPTEAKRPSVTVKPPSAVMTPVALPAATSKPPEVTAAVTSSAEPEKTAAAEQVPLAPLAVSATPAALTTPAALATPVTSATPAPLAPPVPQAQPPPSATVTKPLVAQKHDAKKTEIPAPKSTWWTALAHPFSLPGSLVTNEEAPVPAHARRHSMAPGENQRAQARSNVRMKRAPHVTEELKDFAALLGGALGFTGGGQTAAGPSAAGNVNRGAPQHNEMIEDILDYEYEPRLQQTFESEGTDLVAHRRRRKFGCVGLCGRCFVLFFLISAACGLLFFTFHLGRTLSKNLATPGAKLSTTGATSKTTPPLSVVTSPTSTSPTAKTTEATTTSTTTVLPSTEALYDDPADRVTTCELMNYPNPKPATPVVNTTYMWYKDSSRTQYRKLLCVIDSRYFSSRRPYIVELLPTAHCSELILYALYVKSASNYKVHFKRGYVDVDFIQALRRITNKRTHRGDPIRIHYTLGGAHEDSPNFVEMLAKHELRNGVIEDLRNASSLIDGVNIHWDRPGGACDQEFTPAYFRAFVEALYLRNMSLILTVPPVLELVRKFWLISITRYMDYVIVTTHKLRRKGVLDCSGRREFAVASYLAIRDHVLKETANPFQAAKVVYSIALGADVFRATLPLSSPRLLDAGTPSSVFDGPTVQTNKTSYDHVCRMPKSLFDGDSECAYAIRQQSTGGTELALYAGPEELAVRMRKSYASKMGDTTVAVYDLFLDDFGGNCAHAGGSAATTSPLVVAIAETGLQSSL